MYDSDGTFNPGRLTEPLASMDILITIETQPASTGVVALEPFDSRS